MKNRVSADGAGRDRYESNKNAEGIHPSALFSTYGFYLMLSGSATAQKAGLGFRFLSKSRG